MARGCDASTQNAPAGAASAGTARCGTGVASVVMSVAASSVQAGKTTHNITTQRQGDATAAALAPPSAWRPATQGRRLLVRQDRFRRRACEPVAWHGLSRVAPGGGGGAPRRA